MWNRVERLLIALLSLAALASAGVFIRRELHPIDARVTEQVPPEPELVGNWREAIRYSSRMSGGDSSPSQLVIVSDYECPWCARFEEAYSTRLAMASYIIHLPLRQHRFSRVAAFAARCAEAQDRFREMHLALLSRQDSIRLLPFRDLARRVGVRDVEAFDACQRSLDAAQFIDSSVAAAIRLGARATPTIILNGWRLARTPALEELKESVQRVREGGDPFVQRGKRELR